MRALIESRLSSFGERIATPFAVTFPDGGQFANQDGEPEFRFLFRNARALWRIAAFGHIGLLESYFDGDVDVEGSLALALASGMAGRLDRTMPLTWVRNQWHELRFGNGDWRQAKDNARFHYALGTISTSSGSTWTSSCTRAATGAKGTRTVEERSATRSSTSAARCA
jgi:cyclopropane-fatty-acyl-phospholipid synthase